MIELGESLGRAARALACREPVAPLAQVPDAEHRADPEPREPEHAGADRERTKARSARARRRLGGDDRGRLGRALRPPREHRNSKLARGALLHVEALAPRLRARARCVEPVRAGIDGEVGSEAPVSELASVEEDVGRAGRVAFDDHAKVGEARQELLGPLLRDAYPLGVALLLGDRGGLLELRPGGGDLADLLVTGCEIEQGAELGLDALTLGEALARLGELALVGEGLALTEEPFRQRLVRRRRAVGAGVTRAGEDEDERKEAARERAGRGPLHERQSIAACAGDGTNVIEARKGDTFGALLRRGYPLSLPRSPMTASTDERPRVLIVDDEKFIRDILADFLGMEGYVVRTAEDGAAALNELQKATYDMIISDLKMPRMGGIELLEAARTVAPQALVVIMTGFGTVETAIDAMKRGAYDYILKPFKVEEVIHVVQRGLEKQRLAAENLRLKEALSLYKVTEAIQASLSFGEVLGTLSDTALHEVKADLVSTWLDDGSGSFFERQRLVAPPTIPAERPSTGSLEELMGLEAGTPIEDTSRFGALEPAAFAEHFGSGATLLEHGTKGHRFFKAMPDLLLSSMVAVPLRTKTKLLGWICALSFTKSKRFDEGQRKLLSIVSSRAAAAIENAKLYEDLQATFQQTIEGLAKAIDKMDRYTAGHSERVASYAMLIAQKLGLGPAEVEIVRQSALMHDIGKIGCVLNLNKPGKLTQDEYEIFKKHPGFGKDILDPIRFLHPLIPGVHLHHERWDGRGYPIGLKGQEVPLIARIISVADTYDAMTIDRAYRRALPHEVAVNEIERCSGSQFDPDVANPFTMRLEEWRDECREKGIKIPE